MRETGICPIREELYSQAFDELIRQVTINCAERGFLLVRVRDEIKMTIQAYQTLYESSIAYGMRKALQDEQQRADKLLRQASLEKHCQELEEQISDYKQRIWDMLEEEKRSKDNASALHAEKVAEEKAQIKAFEKQLGEALVVNESK